MRFTEHEKQLLWQCFARHDAGLLSSMDELDSESLMPEELATKMRDAVGSELSQVGFGPDDGPTEYGLELEALIDKLMRTVYP